MDFIEQRIEPREKLALPVQIGDSLRAVTRDISPSGMYLEVRGDYELGGTLWFEMHLDQPHMKFTSEGLVLRVEHQGGCTGVAVKLVSPRLVPLD